MTEEAVERAAQIIYERAKGEFPISMAAARYIANGLADLVATREREARRQGMEETATFITANKFNGGTVYPHMCGSCGLTEEEEAITIAQRRILDIAAKAIRTRAQAEEGTR